MEASYKEIYKSPLAVISEVRAEVSILQVSGGEYINWEPEDI